MSSTGGRTRRVVLFGHPVLRQNANQVDELNDEVRRLIADLKASMLEYDGLGLAANQVAVPLSVFAVDPRGADQDGKPYCVVNPRVVATEGCQEREEGCLSIPGVYDVVTRPELVRLAGIDEEGRPVEIQATGLLARAFMHETDHLSGKLFIDHLSPTRRSMLATRLDDIKAREAAACG